MCISLYGCYNIKLLQGNYEKKKNKQNILYKNDKYWRNSKEKNK